MRKRADGSGRDDHATQMKKRFLKELEKTRDKKEAARVLGMDLHQVRSWRHKDPAFNLEYKRLSVGHDQARQENVGEKKAEVIRFLKMGCSQRTACDEAYVSTMSFRTWKKTDDEFKLEVNRIRHSFGSMKRGGFDPSEGKEEY